MHTFTRPSRLRAWIACLAILLNAFAPLLAQAMQAPAPAAMTVEICTALGMTAMPLALPSADADDGAAGKLHKAMNHCSYCAAHAGVHGLPPPAAMVFAVPAGRDARPPLCQHVSRPLFPWALALARAPPST